MELEGAYVALVQVLEDLGPMAESELEVELRRAGLTDDFVDEVLDHPPDVVVQLPDDRWASLPKLLAPRRLTHRISPEETALDVIVFDVDLIAVVPLLDAGTSMADGTEPQVLDLESALEVLTPRDPQATAALPDAEVLVLPVGYLDQLGLRAGDLMAIRFTHDGAVIERLDEDPTIDRSLADVIASHLHEAPIDSDELIWALCADDPQAFTDATVPFSEVLDEVGASRFGSQVAAPGVDIQAWHRGRRVEDISRTHGLRRGEAEEVLALVEHHALLDAIIGGLTTADFDDEMDQQGAAAQEIDGDPPGRSTDRDMPAGPDDPESGSTLLANQKETADRASGVVASPAAAAALLGEVAGMGRDGLAALGVLAESMESRAPRRARASWRWLQAKALERLGSAVEAESELRAALAMDPDHPLVLEDLGRCASDRGDADHALRLLRRAGVPDDDSLIQTLEAHRASAPKDVGRNDPCWCGSGRKRKHCHRDAAPTLPLEARTAWLSAKTRDYLQQGPHRELVLTLAVERARHLGDGGLLDALGDPLVHDMALLELGAYRDFLAERGPLLPDDERDLIEQWAIVERSLFDVEDVRPGEGLVLRDVRTGDRHEVSERTASLRLQPGFLICTRVVPAGPVEQLVGGVEPVALHQRSLAIELLDEGDPYELIGFLSQRFAPPTLQNTEGEPLVDCTVTIRVADPAALSAALDDRFERNDEDGAPGWDETVVTMGLTRRRSHIRLDDDVATVTANSHERIDRNVALLLDLAPGAEVLTDERTPYTDLLAQSDGPPDPPESLLESDDPQIQEAIRDMVRKMEDAWVDEQIPALGGLTPREAAADPTRRDDLVRLLDSFDRYPSGPGAMDPARLRRLLDL